MILEEDLPAPDSANTQKAECPLQRHCVVVFPKLPDRGVWNMLSCETYPGLR